MVIIMDKILVKDFYISGNECDIFECLHAHALQSNLLDCAFAHADEIGVSRKEINEITGGGVWVLIRLGVELYSPLRYPQEFVIETWPTGVKGPYFGRDYVIRCGDKIFGKASSDWLIVNPDTKRISRGKDLPKYNIDSKPGTETCVELGKRLMPPEQLNCLGQHLVKYSDIDMNRHVNNTRYLAIAGDALELDRRRQQMSAWQINYIEQCVSGELIEMHGGQYGDGAWYIEGNVSGKKRFEIKIALK